MGSDLNLWIIPSILGSSNLYILSDDDWEVISAWIYGFGLCGLFVVSTVFHTIAWRKSHLRMVEHCLHMSDRMVIYFFIAASYAPWLNLRELGPWASHMRWLVWIMASVGTVYVFLFHERCPWRRVTTLILWMKTLKLREGKWPGQGHTAPKWRSCDLGSHLLGLGTARFSLLRGESLAERAERPGQGRETGCAAEAEAPHCLSLSYSSCQMRTVTRSARCPRPGDTLLF
ncbi:monocyte to macrophage differentiation factor 2 isoform X8 [Choloepus didactylus]|uniref:monocyte to macrophage differentiation factor 2 isoform X8 n=1 Tax=Choloepus didactylus TaxID=27675 RepID=UPI00189CBBAC|nr:monocyte to macrophage differentiation factor 2 isoform X8 [Choloepus didactylus]